MMSGNAEFRVVLKIWTSAHTTLTAVIVRIGNDKSASVELSRMLGSVRCIQTPLAVPRSAFRKWGIPGFRGLDSWGVRPEHDRDAVAHMICRHKNVIQIVTNRGKTAA